MSKPTAIKAKSGTTSEQLERFSRDVEASAELSQYLNALLANEYILFTKTLNFHWNITGPRFHSLHQFLDEQYHELLEMLDDVAERVRVIGHYARGTLQEYQELSSLSESPGAWPDTTEMLSELTMDHQIVQAQIKAILDLLEDESESMESDPGTEDFLMGLLTKHEDMSWKLRAHMQ